MRIEEGFQLPIPELSNAYLDDEFLPTLLKRLLPPDFQEPICQDLERLGNDVNGSIRELGKLADTPPTLTQYSHWGQRVDTLHTSEGWRRLKHVAAQEGLVGISYERKYGEYSRVYAFVKTLLFTAEGRVVGCPISMTDGCARVLELLGTDEIKTNILPRLISRDPTRAFTSGQFMTERTGGSDVSLTETVATPIQSGSNSSPGSPYRLDGFKWFSSATDSEVSLALARTGDPSLGSKSLSLFLLPLRFPLPDQNTPTPSGVLTRTFDNVNGESANNGILIHRLKNKIGTHAVPTAELSLTNSLAYLVGPLNGGVKSISSVLQITRIHSSFHSTGCLARCLGIARAYAKVRRIDGGRRSLEQVPLHVATLAKVAVTYRAILSFAINTAHLLGQVETRSPQSPDYQSIHARFRLLNPVLKAFATHHCVPAMEECMAALGGQGYMEETGIGRLIRDASVERIWEGTENVLALDLIRANKKQGDVEPLAYWMEWATSILNNAIRSLDSRQGHERLRSAVQVIKATVESTPTRFAETTKNDLLPHVNLLAFGHVTAALYLLEHAIWSDEMKEADSLVLCRWVLEGGVLGVDLNTLCEGFEDLRKTDYLTRIRKDSALVFGTSLGEGRARL